MDKARCVIIGCARNVAGQLPKTLEKIEAIRALWLEAAVIIAENGSTDGTKRILDVEPATLDGTVYPRPPLSGIRMDVAL